MTKVAEAKAILDTTLNEFFTNIPDADQWQYIRMSFDRICLLLDAADTLLADALTEQK